MVVTFSEGTTGMNEGKQMMDPELASGIAECVAALRRARQEDGGVRVRAGVGGAASGALDGLGQAVNELIVELEAVRKQANHNHDSTMELAIGISEFAQVLSDVSQGNLAARLDESAMGNELMSTVGSSINDTIGRIAEQVETIKRQQFAIQELSTPVLELWDDVLALPVIGVVDSRRAAEIMERLLSEITVKQSKYVVVDITGVELVDTKTADHFVKVIKAAELLGARCVVTGIRPAVAQTLVEIGVDLSSITTVRNLQEGFRECLRMIKERQRGVSDL
jgi:rsbT co-antagonist protein RsbR